MKIDLAVYTAVDGYDWQPGTSYPRSTLVRFKQGIGRLPDPLMEKLPFGGVFNDGDTIVFYRMHMALRSDSKGRDSLYLVLGTLPKNEVNNVDFKYLFALPEFVKPLKPAPTQTIYIGSQASGAAPDYSASFRRLIRGENALSEIGTWFGNLRDGNLSMRITGTYAEPVVSTQYEKLQMHHSAMTGTARNEIPSSSNLPYGMTDNSKHMPAVQAFKQPEKTDVLRILVMPVLLAFIIGCIIGYYARNAKDWFMDTINVIKELKVKQNKPKEKQGIIPTIHEKDNDSQNKQLQSDIPSESYEQQTQVLVPQKQTQEPQEEKILQQEEPTTEELQHKRNKIRDKQSIRKGEVIPQTQEEKVNMPDNTSSLGGKEEYKENKQK